MNRKEKTITAIGFVIVILILLLLFGKRGSVEGETTIVEQGSDFAGFPVDGISVNIGDVLPSLNMPPRNGPIIWPAFDYNTGPSSPYLNGISACGCGRMSVPVYYREEEPAPSPLPALSVPQTVVRSLPSTPMPDYSAASPTPQITRSVSTASFVTAAPETGYVNAAGRVTTGRWW